MLDGLGDSNQFRVAIQPIRVIEPRDGEIRSVLKNQGHSFEEQVTNQTGA
jgi:hypothetical protein